MDKNLFVTIDTEIDNPKGRADFPYSLNNIGGIPKLQELFKKYGVKPTYLITYPVAANKESIDILKKAMSEGTEIGAHLHPWTCPPFESEEEKTEQGYPHNSKLEEEKLIELTRAIKEAFGIKPVSYRAGRYGIDENSIEILKKHGYKIDCSVTPTMNWSNDKGPNFSKIKNSDPYDWNGILEIPITIRIKKGLTLFNKLSPMQKAILKKLDLYKTVWLRPSVSSFSDMKWIIENNESDVLNMMFHSNELMQGTSPYTKDEKKAEEFWKRLDNILDYLVNEQKVKSKTLCEY
jgi:peptidoglycan/xylan/chitin deacetylase (PgdA/CDA1 family)